ncbi:type II toxin-antitoxin system RelE/ParE family toxin [Nitrospirillum amazonense]|uniref:type II toxin-antitoxin system RelE/ParE family toxin n=1 Tax=Nitrospirillum amazonense TaxID=28077 RepID=UPI0011A9AC97
MRVVWSVPALRDVIGHRAYIAQFNPIAAIDIAQRLAAAGDSLKTFPQPWSPRLIIDGLSQPCHSL